MRRSLHIVEVRIRDEVTETVLHLESAELGNCGGEGVTWQVHDRGCAQREDIEEWDEDRYNEHMTELD
jgi:hypothetical protein